MLLQRQIEQGAPFDLFFAADLRSVEELSQQNLISENGVHIYATGVLTESPPGGLLNASRIAIANPRHAPYGKAAREVLQSLGLWDSDKERLLIAGSASQALALLQQGEAEAALLPKSLAISSGLPHRDLTGLHRPIHQAVGVIAGGDENSARKFVEFAISPAGQAIFQKYGYGPPQEVDRLTNPPAAESPVSLWSPVILTLRVSAAATVLSLFAGGFAGYFLAIARFPGRAFLLSATLLPLFLPPTVLGYFLLVAVGSQSTLGRAWEAVTGAPLAFTEGAAVMAACVSAAPIVARQLVYAFASLEGDVLEAARIDGANWRRILLEIRLPLAQPALLSAAAIAFARSSGDFGATLMVAGNMPGRTQTASIAIYDAIAAGDMQQAGMLVLLITGLSLTVLIILASQEAALK